MQSFESNIQTFNANTLSFVVNWKLARPSPATHAC